MKDKPLVLDTSAILSRKLNLGQENIIVPNSVMDEIKLGKMARSLSWHEESLDLREPSPDSLKKVREAATETGDFKALSSTDMDVIALALDTGGIVVSDDFAIENVSSRLGISFIGADLKPITKDIKWQFRCTGCGEKFSEHVENCPICGHSVKRAVKSYKRR